MAPSSILTLVQMGLLVVVVLVVVGLVIIQRYAVAKWWHQRLTYNQERLSLEPHKPKPPFSPAPTASVDTENVHDVTSEEHTNHHFTTLCEDG